MMPGSDKAGTVAGDHPFAAPGVRGRRGLRWVLLLALLPALPLAAQRAPPDVAIHCVRKSNHVLVAGQIGLDFDRQLERVLQACPQARVVELESPGGFIGAALRAGAMLGRRGLAARVRGDCASACVLVWAQAARRQLGPQARLGLHAGRMEQGVLAKNEVPHAEAMGRQISTSVLARAGFPARLIDKGEDTPHERVLWLTPSQLANVGVVFQHHP